MALNSSSTRVSRRTSVTIRNIRLTALFKPEDIIHHTECSTPPEIVRKLLEHLALYYGIGNIDVATDEVMGSVSKEDSYPCDGMSVLYGRLERVTDPLVALATSEGGIMFDGRKTFLIAVVLAPMDMPGTYKQILHGLVRACEGDEMVKKVAMLQSPLAVWQHFDAGGHRLPDHLQARHIMAPPHVYLDSNDSLAKAIDLFLAHRQAELPVLSPEKELIGVVTTRRLVKVCMPDYLMWLDDLTPFLNFEPIADIIRNESSTWLKEIMVSNFAYVTEDSPAILALKEIGRKETDSAYVLRGRKLIGIIHLHEFMNAVLR